MKALQETDILQETCPTIVSCPSICFKTATARGSCEFPTLRWHFNSPIIGFSQIALYAAFCGELFLHAVNFFTAFA